jgi:hypothetical protein
MQSKRGGVLTVLVVLFGIAAIQDALKPLHLEGPTTGLVFLGTRLSGEANLILSILVALFLAAYAIGVWRMSRYALPLSFIYAVYVLINIVVFPIKYAGQNNGSMAFMIAFIILALAIPWSAALILWRRRTELA